MTGKAEEDFVQNTKKIELIKPQLWSPGTAKIIDYTKYGTFENVGTENIIID